MTQNTIPLNATIQIRETYTNEDQGYQFGDTEWYEPYTDNIGRLFRSLQREYGRCVSTIYVDTPNGTRKCGWYFEKVMQYDDARTKEDTYTRGVWVQYRTVYDPSPEDSMLALDLFGAA
jgi:hypothetical protein